MESKRIAIQEQQPKHIVPYYIEDCPEWTAPSGAWGIRGMSKGSYYTGFVGTGLLNKLCLDMGIHTRIVPRAILITHTHADHFSALPDAVLYCDHPITVCCPIPAVLPIKAALVGDAAVAECTTKPEMGLEGIPHRYNIHFNPLDKGWMVTLDGSLSVTAVYMIHTIPCIGYVVSERRRKLRREFASISQDELVEKKKRGIEVSESIEAPLLLFFGDTEISAVALAMERYRGIPVAIVECTWLEGIPGVSSMFDESEGGGHCAWTGGLELIIKENPKTTFVLIHFSARYNDTHIIDYLTKNTDCSYDGVVMWLESGPLTIGDARKRYC